MGGRGSGSGKSSVGSAKPKYFKESEKAVQLQLNMRSYTVDGDEVLLNRMVWIPKSQLNDEGKPSEWITKQKMDEIGNSRTRGGINEYSYSDANGREFSAVKSAIELEKSNRFQQGVESYNNLLKKAKDLGIKGVRKGMKRQTIQRRIDEFNNHK